MVNMMPKWLLKYLHNRNNAGKMLKREEMLHNFCEGRGCETAARRARSGSSVGPAQPVRGAGPIQLYRLAGEGEESECVACGRRVAEGKGRGGRGGEGR